MTSSPPPPSASLRMPELPLTCLRTAEYTSTTDAFEGKNVVVDFWTTKCVRCPAALDDLDELSRRPEYAEVQFVSICLDSCDGARNVIERDDVPRWGNVRHYHMEAEYKEEAKEILGFAQVPFYAVMNDRGDVVMRGSKKRVNFDDVPGMIRPPTATSPQRFEERNFSTPVKKVNDIRDIQPSPVCVEQFDRVFTLDDDF
eukprot:CAMPEP_0113535232 /NCGR_PEP_ID=MMETSP0015_2-20120614/5590_1 /TAXON_ID=2838 /ORGANISM="Odontella" /LENGTH=199 /DNA_ID=CAMNT_0000434461 /DNA_START=127 /DNA_END=726 /DNA_ORIENTATION=- /assembly_acc=CAM_ASM_000160